MEENKILNKYKNNTIFWSLFYIILSIAIVVFIFGIYNTTLTTYHKYFLNEGQGSPPSECVNSFLSITLPFMIAYSITYIFIYKKISLQFLIYPLTFFTLFAYYWLYRSLAVGPAYGWSIFWMGPLLVLGILVTFAIGIISNINKKEKQATINDPNFSNDLNKKMSKMNTTSIVTLIWICFVFGFWSLLAINNHFMLPINIVLQIIPITLLIIVIFTKNNNLKIVCNIISQFFIIFAPYTIVSIILIIINSIYIISAIKSTTKYR